MKEETLREILTAFREGRLDMAATLEKLRTWPFEDLGFARIDHHRSLRRGYPEVIFGKGKSARQIAEIAAAMERRGVNVLVTRVDPHKAARVQEQVRAAVYHEQARALTVSHADMPRKARGTILVVAAGTSDIPVAEEARVTAEMMGSRVERLYDVGVAGLHRLLHNLEELRRATVHVVVAGMEGALPSVVGGLVDTPVIAVPTSIGYGASFEGLAALLAMLNSCAPGVAVVNIDNGFGAGYLAALIYQLSVIRSIGHPAMIARSAIASQPPSLLAFQPSSLTGAINGSRNLQVAPAAVYTITSCRQSCPTNRNQDRPPQSKAGHWAQGSGRRVKDSAMRCTVPR
ncbi:MAG: nickel pincer cofactor biosynthesis protein LarB [Deltaproteobacteria bacterium]|nr:nickel pincer cofactor biosynthesis protein LarB [Deltaproteobacteria bacterium]